MLRVHRPRFQIAIGVLFWNFGAYTAKGSKQVADFPPLPGGIGAELESALPQLAVGGQLGPGRPICGGPEISTMLGLQDIPKVDYLSIKTIPWASIMRQADDFIVKQNAQIQKLQLALEQYSALVPQLQLDGLDGKSAMSAEALEQLLAQVLTESFGGLAQAEASGCGIRSDGDVGGYQAADEAFVAAIEKKMQGQQWIGKHNVARVCKLLLHVDGQHVDATGDTVCAELCAAFGAAAESMSREPLSSYYTDVPPSYDELVTKMKVAQEKLNTRQREVLECEQDRSMLMEFGAKMHNFKTELDQHFKEERMALIELRRVEREMQSSVKALKVQSERTLALARLLSSTKDDAAGVHALITRLAATETQLAGKTEEMQRSIKELQQQVSAAGDAVRSFKEFKTTLEVVMHDLVQVYDRTIREPLRQTGVAAVMLKLERSRWSNVSCLEKRVRLRVEDNQNALQKTCGEVVETTSKVQCMETEGKFVVQAAALNETCLHYEQQQEDYIREIVEIVSSHQKRAAQLLNKLRCYSDPYTCSRLDSLQEEAKVNAGEPAYLQRVLSIYSDSIFVKEYASHWRYSEDASGVILELNKKLQALYRLLLSQEEGSRAAFADLIRAHAQTLATKQQLNLQLTKALAEQRCEELKTMEGNRAVKEFETHLGQLADMQDLFNKSATSAMHAYEQSKVQMRKEFIENRFVKHASESEGVSHEVDIDVPSKEESSSEGVLGLLNGILSGGGRPSSGTHAQNFSDGADDRALVLLRGPGLALNDVLSGLAGLTSIAGGSQNGTRVLVLGSGLRNNETRLAGLTSIAGDSQNSTRYLQTGSGMTNNETRIPSSSIGEPWLHHNPTVSSRGSGDSLGSTLAGLASVLKSSLTGLPSRDSEEAFLKPSNPTQGSAHVEASNTGFANVVASNTKDSGLRSGPLMKVAISPNGNVEEDTSTDAFLGLDKLLGGANDSALGLDKLLGGTDDMTRLPVTIGDKQQNLTYLLAA